MRSVLKQNKIQIKALAVVSLVVSLIMAMIVSFSFSAHAANRPFPKYDLSFQWIHGQVDPQWKPGDDGDGCLRSEDPEITPLSTFGFHTVINPCDGIRTTMRWFYDDDQLTGDNVAPTNQFRLGVTWQYTRRDTNEPYFWKPVENMTLDGKPIDQAKYNPADQESVVVKKTNGEWSHIPDRPSGFFEPKHVVFDDLFGFDQEHTFVWDTYLPVFGDGGGMTIGTGSTGDTQGGSIGAKANGLYVSIPAYADFRYVLDSEYRQALDVPQISAEGETVKIPHRPLAGWSGPLEGSTYTTVKCLESEDQFLAPIVTGQKTSEIYPDLAQKYPSVAHSTGESQIADGAGSYALGRWPYEFSLRQPGTWASTSGLRVMNHDSATDSFLDYGDKDLPYKPTFDSVKKDIPGYTYVDNDLPIEEKGTYDSMTSGGIPLFKSAPNIRLSYHKTVGQETQHLYLTYKKNPGTFRVEKTDPDGHPIAGAKFALYEVINNSATPCGQTPDMTGAEEIEVCDSADPQNCEKVTARQVKLNDFDAKDGTFVTDKDGKYTPSGEPSLPPGKYIVKELSVPEPYLISTPYTLFNIPIQAGKDTDGTLVSMLVPGVAKVVNYPELVSVPVSKVWKDADNQDGIRPDRVVIELLADGVRTGVTRELNAENNWSALFDGLAKKKAGRVIEYSVVEEPVKGYKSVVNGKATSGFVVTNTHTPSVPPEPPTPPTSQPKLAKTGIAASSAGLFAILLGATGIAVIASKRLNWLTGIDDQ
ncbi:Cna B-type domain-containing protein [Arcanobacterium phocae]|uniref:Cna B-type domain-containing protein n=1 Tax=Arcanobacterium phocae TaxID=131112 RepID=UPI001C0F019D|nr:Cna B-type domain-containing protein [Arcanobacterium phocae]